MSVDPWLVNSGSIALGAIAEWQTKNEEARKLSSQCTDELFVAINQSIMSISGVTPEPPVAMTPAERIQQLRGALNAASFALFQIKRMVSDSIPNFADEAHRKACAVLDGDFPGPDGNVRFYYTILPAGMSFEDFLRSQEKKDDPSAP